jgi:hypothetical protein
MTTDINTDVLLERLRERQEHIDFCANCGASITDTDKVLGECTQCESGIVADESADEGLWDDGYGDC